MRAWAVDTMFPWAMLSYFYASIGKDCQQLSQKPPER